MSAMLVEHEGPHRLRITVDGGDRFIVQQSPDGARLEIVGLGGGGGRTFTIEPRVSNSITVGNR